MKLTQAGKEEIALALILWKDFKCAGKFDIDVNIQLFAFADILGVRKETETMLSKLPPMKIEPRFKD